MKSLNISLPDSSITFYPKFLPQKLSNQLYLSLLEEVDWTQNDITIFGKTYKVPRLEAWYGDQDKSYTYSGITMSPKPWLDSLLFIKSQIESEIPQHFNSVLINYYRNGNDRVGLHSDDEKELGSLPSIASVSLGADRLFRLKHKKFKQNGLSESLTLPGGSLLVMEGITQKHWKHEVPRTSKPIGGRINLTYRNIVN